MAVEGLVQRLPRCHDLGPASSQVMGSLDDAPCRPAIHDEATVDSGDRPRDSEALLLKIREHLRGPGGRVDVVHRLQNHPGGAPGVALTTRLRPGVRASETKRHEHVLGGAAGSHEKRLPSIIRSPTRNRRRHRRHGIHDAVASAPRQKRMSEKALSAAVRYR